MEKKNHPDEGLLKYDPDLEKSFRKFLTVYSKQIIAFLDTDLDYDEMIGRITGEFYEFFVREWLPLQLSELSYQTVASLRQLFPHYLHETDNLIRILADLRESTNFDKDQLQGILLTEEETAWYLTEIFSQRKQNMPALRAELNPPDIFGKQTMRIRDYRYGDSYAPKKASWTTPDSMLLLGKLDTEANLPVILSIEATIHDTTKYGGSHEVENRLEKKLRAFQNLQSHDPVGLLRETIPMFVVPSDMFISSWVAEQSLVLHTKSTIKDIHNVVDTLFLQ